jgi:hypothetical protein
MLSASLDEVLSHGVEYVKHHEGLVADGGVTVGNAGGYAVEVSLLDVAALLAYGERCLASVDYADLFVGVGVHGDRVPWQRGVEDHHHPLPAEACEDGGLQSLHLGETGGLRWVDEVLWSRHMDHRDFCRV